MASVHVGIVTLPANVGISGMLELTLVLCLAAEIGPGSQPQLVSDGKITGIIFGADRTIYYAQPDSEPVRVAEVADLSLGNHRGPRIAFTAGAIVVTAGVGPGMNTLKSWRSLDRGKTWTSGPDLSSRGTGGMGFQAIASDGKKRLWAAWIGPSNGHPTFFMSHSDDEGVTWTPQRVLSETVCECCHPTIAVAADGTVHILFRNSVDGNRDMYIATSKDGESFQFMKLGTGSWPINACPMDGGGMSELNGQIVTLWRRRDQLFLARPDGNEEESFGTGKNAAIALRSNGSYAVWQSSEGITVKAPGKDLRVVSKTGSFPAISNQGPVIIAWEDGGKIHVERLD